MSPRLRSIGATRPRFPPCSRKHLDTCYILILRRSDYPDHRQTVAAEAATPTIRVHQKAVSAEALNAQKKNCFPFSLHPGRAAKAAQFLASSSTLHRSPFRKRSASRHRRISPGNFRRVRNESHSKIRCQTAAFFPGGRLPPPEDRGGRGFTRHI